MAHLFRNSILNFLSQVVLFLASFFTSVILARYLGPQGMGKYSFLLWILSIITLSINLGLPTTIIRFTAKYSGPNDIVKARRILSRMVIFEFGVSMLVTLVFILANLTVNSNHDKINYFIVAFTIPSQVFVNIAGSFLQGLQKYQVILKINSLLSLVNIFLILTAVLLKAQLPGLLLINLLITLINSATQLFILRQHLNLASPRLDRPIFKELSGYALTVSVIAFLDFVVWQRSEVFFLKTFSDFAQVGFYSLSYGLVSRVMMLFPGAISGVILPKVSGLQINNEKQKIGETYFASTRYLSFIVFPLICLGGLFAKDLVEISFGESYLPMVQVVRILLISGGLGSIAAAAAAVTYGVGNQKFILKTGLIVTICNISLDLLLIPKMGAIGAALANGIAQVGAVIAGTIFVAFIKKFPFPWPDLVRILTACSLSTVAVYIAQSYLVFPPMFSVAVFGLAFLGLYALGLYLLKFFKSYDYQLLKMPLKLAFWWS